MMTSGALTLPLGRPTDTGWHCRDDIIEGLSRSLPLNMTFVEVYAKLNGTTGDTPNPGINLKRAVRDDLMEKP